jgi:hypothetical protein
MGSSFSETQKFSQWWVWVIILGAMVLPFADIFKNGFQSDDPEMYFILLIPFAVMVLFLSLRLETRVDGTGVYYKFFPFHFKAQHKTWDEIEKAFVRKYKPVSEYGGWGIRMGLGHGKAFNVRGNMGLQLIFKNGKRTLIGTQKPEELRAFIEQLVASGVVQTTNEPYEIPQVKERF